MTLVHNDQIEEIRREQLAEVFLIIVTHQLLIQGEVHLVGCDGALIVLGNVDLVRHLLQRREVLLNRLIHQDVAVSQVKNLALQAALQKTIHNLECCISLACTGSHDKQQTILPLGNGIQCAVDGNALIIARRIGSLTAIVGLFDNGFLRRRQGRLRLIAGNQLFFRRELIQAKLTLCTCEKIMLGKTIAIGAEGERNIQHLRISHGLLQTMRDAVLVVLRFYNGNGIVSIQVQNVVSALGLLTEDKVPLQVDLSIRDLCLHGDLPHGPLGGQRGGDVLQLDVFFSHRMLWEYHAHPGALLFSLRWGRSP